MASESVIIDAHELMNRAQCETGLRDFGDEWFLEPLTQLIAFINRDAGLPSKDVHPVDLIANCLADRLRLVEYLERHPTVRDEKVEVAGVIVSGRGGSTFLQRLLAASPQLTSCYGWETTVPVPLPEEQIGENFARMKVAQKVADKMRELWPEYVAIHPLETQEVNYEEELALMDRSFVSQMFACYFHIPDYNRWELRFDQRKVYEELHLWLQLLQYQSPSRLGRKWLLKSVQHMIGGGLFDLARQFPQAKIIMTHRHLASVLGSWASAQAPLMRPSGSTTFDVSKLGALVLQTYREGLLHFMDARDRLPADRFIDVQYEVLMTDPLSEYRRLLGNMGLTVTPADEEAAVGWLSRNGRDTHPAHHYRLEDYGSSAAEVEEMFKFYHERFVG